MRLYGTKNLQNKTKGEDTNMHLKKFSWYLTPALSVVLSFPTLLGCLAVWSLVTYEVIVKDMKGTLLLSLWDKFPSSLFAWFVLYIVFGPLLACALCAGQLARSQDKGTRANGASSLVLRLTRVALLVAGASACLLLLSVGIAFALRGRT